MLSLGATLQTRLGQSQTLSPRLQQAVRLLQMSSLDFAQSLADARDQNPFLESMEEHDALLPVSLRGLVASDQSAASAPSDTDRPVLDMPDEDAMAGEAVSAESGVDETSGWSEGAPRGAHGEGEYDATDMASAPATLTDHLVAQLQMLSLDERERALCMLVVGSLEEDGYLRSDLREVLEALQPNTVASTEELHRALCRVQSLDPAGIAARSVVECLQLQLGGIAAAGLRSLAGRILTEQLKLLAARDGPGLARALRCDLAEVEAACQAIRRLDPKPGLRFNAPATQYVAADVVVRRKGNRWVALLNPAIVPRLQLNENVAALYRRHQGPACPALAHQLQEARWTLRNVEQRFSTIVMVARAIVDRQQNYFDYGEMAMRPLGLQEIADEVGVHESTVSRVTCNKFIATPTGIVELKHFFSRAMVMASGNACSGTAIRGLVRDIIDAEPGDRPLSDAAITALLGQQGLQVARRTVTKYRLAMRIEPVARRRSLPAVL